MFIRDFCSVNKQTGEVGIEIEVEGDDLPYSVNGWRKEEDGSLRGESGEFVLEDPCPRGHVHARLSDVYNAYEECETYIKPSTRQSVHVHINIQDMTITQVYTFILTFIIFEELMVDYCGEGRTGNLFCLRAKDAGYFLHTLADSASARRFTRLATDTLRYSAVNVASLFKYGSLEFRSMRGGTDQATLELWIKMLLAIKDYAMLKGDPKDLAVDFKDMDVEAFIDLVFKQHSHVLKKDGYERSIREGARLIKMVAYSGDWEGLTAEKVKEKKQPITSIDFEPVATESVVDMLHGIRPSDISPPEPVEVAPRRTRRSYPQFIIAPPGFTEDYSLVDDDF